MAALDISIVAVALPSIEDAFGTRTTVTEWVALAYLLPLIALSLPSGRWLDRVGKRPAMIVLVVGVAVTSVLVGAASWFGWLIAALVGRCDIGARFGANTLHRWMPWLASQVNRRVSAGVDHVALLARSFGHGDPRSEHRRAPS